VPALEAEGLASWAREQHASDRGLGRVEHASEQGERVALEEPDREPSQPRGALRRLVARRRGLASSSPQGATRRAARRAQVRRGAATRVTAASDGCPAGRTAGGETGGGGGRPGASDRWRLRRTGPGGGRARGSAPSGQSRGGTRSAGQVVVSSAANGRVASRCAAGARRRWPRSPPSLALPRRRGRAPAPRRARAPGDLPRVGLRPRRPAAPCGGNLLRVRPRDWQERRAGRRP
jgi:hypothetical protein